VVRRNRLLAAVLEVVVVEEHAHVVVVLVGEEAEAPYLLTSLADR
jgi:hypothetical protein